MTVIPDGMTPWHGGDSAPVDWDGGPVQFRDGKTGPFSFRYARNWNHDIKSHDDIIAYTRDLSVPVAIDPADYFTDTAFQLTTCDPAFDPAKPVDINGYRYVPEQMA